MKMFESSRVKSASKNLIRLLPVQDGSGDLLDRLLAHANDRAGVLATATQQQEEAKSNS
jgi:hypothetical protein